MLRSSVLLLVLLTHFCVTRGSHPPSPFQSSNTGDESTTSVTPAATTTTVATTTVPPTTPTTPTTTQTIPTSTTVQTTTTIPTTTTPPTTTPTTTTTTPTTTSTIPPTTTTVSTTTENCETTPVTHTTTVVTTKSIILTTLLPSTSTWTTQTSTVPRTTTLTRKAVLPTKPNLPKQNIPMVIYVRTPQQAAPRPAYPQQVLQYQRQIPTYQYQHQQQIQGQRTVAAYPYAQRARPVYRVCYEGSVGACTSCHYKDEYLICHYGQWRVGRCPRDQQFDAKTYRCQQQYTYYPYDAASALMSPEMLDALS